MIYTPATRLALQIAEEAHRGQTDSAGFPYILHPILVAEQQKIEAAVVAALLHDVCEDCGHHPERAVGSGRAQGGRGGRPAG